MQKIDTLIFDLDGTLVDTRPHAVACINNALAQIEENPIDIGTITQAISRTLRDTFRAILPPRAENRKSPPPSPNPGNHENTRK